jgi:hypothetical protein
MVQRRAMVSDSRGTREMITLTHKRGQSGTVGLSRARISLRAPTSAAFRVAGNRRIVPAFATSLASRLLRDQPHVHPTPSIQAYLEAWRRYRNRRRPTRGRSRQQRPATPPHTGRMLAGGVRSLACPRGLPAPTKPCGRVLCLSVPCRSPRSNGCRS